MATSGVVEKLTYQRTVDAKPNDVSIVKPGELVDVIEMSPLTLADRRVYNLLIANAWDSITERTQHSIRKSELQGTAHKGTDRLEDSIRRLMSAIVEVKVFTGGKSVTKRVQLLGGNVIPDADDGMVRYDFHPIMLEIISESRVFARLHRRIMFALTSKYSLALYEMVQKRGNLSRSSEEFSVSQLRGYLGVAPDRLTSWINLRNKAIDPAVREVSLLSDFDVSYETIKGTEKGKTKQITAVRLIWGRKEASVLEDVERELNRPKFGRKARLSGTVEEICFSAAADSSWSIPSLKEQTRRSARKILPDHDIYQVESEWRDWVIGKDIVESIDASFLDFCRSYEKPIELD